MNELAIASDVISTINRLPGVQMCVESREKLRVRVEKDAPFEVAEDAMSIFFGCGHGETQKLMSLMLKLQTEGFVETIDKAPHSATEGNGGWCDCAITTDYLKPYWEALRRTAGCIPFSVSIPSLVRIRHTYSCLAAEYTETSKLLHCRVISCIYPHVGCCFGESPEDSHLRSEGDFLTAARQHMTWDIDEDLGSTVLTPEYIETGNGLYRRNPDYPGGPKHARPALENEGVWGDIWQAWLQQFATYEQKKMWNKIRDCQPFADRIPYRAPELGGLYRDHTHYDGYNKTIKWKEFQAL